MIIFYFFITQIDDYKDKIIKKSIFLFKFNMNNDNEKYKIEKISKNIIDKKNYKNNL